MNFTGFTLPDGAWLPPELIYLLPNISGSKLKAVIAILYHNLQVGGGEPLSLKDVEKYTGLSRQAVIDALRDLMEDGLVERQALGMSYVYMPVIKVVKKLDYPVQKLDQSKNLTGSADELRESDSELKVNYLTDSLNLTNAEAGLKIGLVQELRACGVYLKTAQGLAAEHSEDLIRQEIGYYRHALLANLAQGPGWLVQAVKEHWGEPLGWKAGSNGRCICVRCMTIKDHDSSEYADWEDG